MLTSPQCELERLTGFSARIYIVIINCITAPTSIDLIVIVRTTQGYSKAEYKICFCFFYVYF